MSFELITRNLQEVVDEDRLKAIVEERPLKVYWGTAPTGRIHVGYFVGMFKIRDLLNAGCEVKVLLADMHAYLDNMKSSLEQLEARTEYYRLTITEMLKAVGADVSKLTFVKGRDYQFREDYTFDMYKIASLASVRDATRAGSEVVKQVEHPRLSGLLYPILQALDEIYLDVDAQFGGMDQRKIFMFAREFLPQIGHTKQIHLMNPMIGSLSEDGKMSASDPNSKVDVLDDAKTVRKKLNKGHCVAGEVDDNFFIDFARIVIFPHRQDEGKPFIIDRPEKFGGPLSYATYDELVAAFSSQQLHPLDLKMGVASYIDELLAPIRTMAETKEFRAVLAKAYEE